MKHKRIIDRIFYAVLVSVILFMITGVIESSVFIRRIYKDQAFIQEKLQQRDKIGSRQFGRFLSIFSLKERDKVARGYISERLLSNWACHDLLPEDIRTAGLLDFMDIVRIGDSRGQHRYRLIFTQGAQIATAHWSGVITLDINLFLKTENEAEIAGVIAHEIGHIVLEHDLAKFNYSRGLQDIFYLPIKIYFLRFADEYGFKVEGARRLKEQEEADALAIQYLYVLGYNPTSYLNFYKRAFPNQVRLEAMQKEIDSINSGLAKKEYVEFRYFMPFQLASYKKMVSEKLETILVIE